VRLHRFSARRPAGGEEIKLHVKNNLARYQVPRDVVFIDELPHNAMGKLLRRVLTEMDVDS
jgi:fatty-acyl-CoA synthase